MESAQAEAGRPAWVTVKVSVPMDTVPVRARELGFSEMASVRRLPPRRPWPLSASTTEIQLTLGEALHSVTARALTVMGITWAR